LVQPDPGTIPEEGAISVPVRSIPVSRLPVQVSMLQDFFLRQWCPEAEFFVICESVINDLGTNSEHDEHELCGAIL
jgi:hypothetical protein